MATKISPHGSGKTGNKTPLKTTTIERATASVQTRVRRKDKALWVKAANRAVKQGLIQADSRGALTPWLIYVLNNAATAKNGTNGYSHNSTPLNHRR